MPNFMLPPSSTRNRIEGRKDVLPGFSPFSSLPESALFAWIIAASSSRPSRQFTGAESEKPRLSRPALYTSFKPLGDRVQVTIKTVEEKTQAGILLPTTAQMKFPGGEVVHRSGVKEAPIEGVEEPVLGFGGGESRMGPMLD
ncbi:hypothetical protein CRG98_014864 [Punica granatum]|uniref:Uncharacterized protein n=1 Tax=Punica granatum TaxID=22663 RepID=A0A2I0K870_PUNGR|nr:hypothetical protein CRG98_014864 [Punica granatum]